jgi:hypothetical protein
VDRQAALESHRPEGGGRGDRAEAGRTGQVRCKALRKVPTGILCFTGLASSPAAAPAISDRVDMPCWATGVLLALRPSPGWPPYDSGRPRQVAADVVAGQLAQVSGDSWARSMPAGPLPLFLPELRRRSLSRRGMMGPGLHRGTRFGSNCLGLLTSAVGSVRDGASTGSVFWSTLGENCCHRGFGAIALGVDLPSCTRNRAIWE